MEKDKIKTPKRGASLQSLYPKPKTYEQIETDRGESALRRAARMPKHPYLRRTGKLLFVIVTALVFIAIIPGLVMMNVISGVFFSFFLLLVWAGLVWWTFN